MDVCYVTLFPSWMWREGLVLMHRLSIIVDVDKRISKIKKCNQNFSTMMKIKGLLGDIWSYECPHRRLDILASALRLFLGLNKTQFFSFSVPFTFLCHSVLQPVTCQFSIHCRLIRTTFAHTKRSRCRESIENGSSWMAFWRIRNMVWNAELRAGRRRELHNQLWSTSDGRLLVIHWYNPCSASALAPAMGCPGSDALTLGLDGHHTTGDQQISKFVFIKPCLTQRLRLGVTKSAPELQFAPNQERIQIGIIIPFLYACTFHRRGWK